MSIKQEIQKLQEELINPFPDGIEGNPWTGVIRKNIKEIAEIKLETWKQALTSEIEFLENQIKNVKRHKSCVSCFRLLRTSEERIAKLKGALE